MSDGCAPGSRLWLWMWLWSSLGVMRCASLHGAPSSAARITSRIVAAGL